MENIQDKQHQATADQFWKTYFSDYLDRNIDEPYAQEIDFWNNLNIALQSVNVDVIQSVIVSKILLRIVNVNMHRRIARIAKQVWDTKKSQH